MLNVSFQFAMIPKKAVFLRFVQMVSANIALQNVLIAVRLVRDCSKELMCPSCNGLRLVRSSALVLEL